VQDQIGVQCATVLLVALQCLAAAIGVC